MPTAPSVGPLTAFPASTAIALQPGVGATLAPAAALPPKLTTSLGGASPALAPSISIDTAAAVASPAGASSFSFGPRPPIVSIGGLPSRSTSLAAPSSIEPTPQFSFTLPTGVPDAASLQNCRLH